MKRIILLLAAIGFTASFGLAQRGSNGYHTGNSGQGFNNGPRGGQNHAPRGTVRGGTRGGGNYGVNRGGTRRGNQGVNRGGVRGGNYGVNHGNRGTVRRGTRVYGNTGVVRGGTWRNTRTCTTVRTNRRTRWEFSNCGRYKYEVIENGYWVPGYYSYFDGCRSWVAGYWDWRPFRRNRVCIGGGFYR